MVCVVDHQASVVAKHVECGQGNITEFPATAHFGFEKLRDTSKSSESELKATPVAVIQLHIRAHVLLLLCVAAGTALPSRIATGLSIELRLRTFSAVEKCEFFF